jgi:hypothetical protein
MIRVPFFSGFLVLFKDRAYNGTQQTGNGGGGGIGRRPAAAADIPRSGGAGRISAKKRYVRREVK